MDSYAAEQIYSYFFSFYFFYLLFYLGHGHVAGLVAGLGSLTSSLSVLEFTVIRGYGVCRWTQAAIGHV